MLLPCARNEVGNSRDKAGKQRTVRAPQARKKLCAPEGGGSSSLENSAIGAPHVELSPTLSYLALELLKISFYPRENVAVNDARRETLKLAILRHDIEEMMTCTPGKHSCTFLRASSSWIAFEKECRKADDHHVRG